MTELAFQRTLGVSRETIERLRRYEALLRKWNPRINLISRATLDEIWSRHFLDSAQIFALAPSSARSWADLGSGGGFPGLVVAALAMERARGLDVVLVESDGRKAAFLATVARELGLRVTVRAERAENIAPLGADVLSARALAPLRELLPLAERHLAPGGAALFPKGANHAGELRQALEGWRFSQVTTPSLTDPGAVIYKITEVARA